MHWIPDDEDIAPCSTTDPEIWYPEKGANPHTTTDICCRCPLQYDCLQAAIDQNEDGIWGGAGEGARARLRIQLNREGRKLRHSDLPTKFVGPVRLTKEEVRDIVGEARMITGLSHEKYRRRYGQGLRLARQIIEKGSTP